MLSNSMNDGAKSAALSPPLQRNISMLLTRRKGLLELVGLVRVRHAQSVQIFGAPDLELGHATSLLDLDRPRVLATSSQQEVLNLVNLLWLHGVEKSYELQFYPRTGGATLGNGVEHIWLTIFTAGA